MRYTPCERGSEQIAAVSKALNGHENLRLWVDLEKDATNQTWPTKDEFAAFSAEAQSLMEPGIGCYTSSYMVRVVGFNPWTDLQGFSRMPLWVADWNRDYFKKPRTPKGAPAWKIQQYTSSGSVPGITGRVDLDVWNGSLRSLATFCG